MSACDFSLSDQEIAKVFAGKGEANFPRYHYTNNNKKKQEFNLHYAQTGQCLRAVSTDNLQAVNSAPQETSILFVHGSPGAWSNFVHYLADSKLAARACMISVDRLGFGKSNAEQAEPNLTKQAQAIAPVLEQLDGKIILVGHSYGGAVIARLALMHPKRIRGLVFLAGSFHDDSEEVYWYNHLGNMRLLRPLLGKDLRHSNAEILALKEELRSLQALWNRWGNLKIPVMALHGEKDTLVPLAHTRFLENLVRKKKTLGFFYYPPKMGHFFIWNHREYVTEKIIFFLHELAQHELSQQKL